MPPPCYSQLVGSLPLSGLYTARTPALKAPERWSIWGAVPLRGGGVYKGRFYGRPKGNRIFQRLVPGIATQFDK
jgi:hypothetical protein